MQFGLVALLLGLAGGTAFACSPHPPKKLGLQMFVHEANSDSTLKMFVGRVIEIRDVKPAKGHQSDQRVRLQVVERLQGTTEDSVSIAVYVADLQLSPCPSSIADMKVGQTWFIAGKQEGEVVWPLSPSELLPSGVLPPDTRELLESLR